MFLISFLLPVVNAVSRSLVRYNLAGKDGSLVGNILSFMGYPTRAVGRGCVKKPSGVIVCPSVLPEAGCFHAPDLEHHYVRQSEDVFELNDLEFVEQGFDSKKSESVIMKTTFADPSDPNALERMMMEAELAMLLSGKHSNLACTSAAVVYDDASCLVMENYQGTLSSVLESLPSFQGEVWMREEQARDLMRQLLGAVGQMHSAWRYIRGMVTHNNLKPENVLLRDGESDVALSGFFMSSVHPKRNPDLIYTGGETDEYIPLRLRKTNRFFALAYPRTPLLELDLYALGMILFKMLHGVDKKLSFVPQSQAPAVSIDSWALEQRVPVLDRFRLSSKAADLLTQLLTGHPEVIRGGVPAVLEHPWFSTPASELALEIQRNLHDDQLFELSLLGEWRWRKRAAFAHLRKQLQKAAAPLLVPATSSRYSMRGWHAFLPSSEVDFSSASAVEMERKRR